MHIMYIYVHKLRLILNIHKSRYDITNLELYVILMIKIQKNNRKKKFKEFWNWLLEKIETDHERLLRIARKNIKQFKIHD